MVLCYWKFPKKWEHLTIECTPTRICCTLNCLSEVWVSPRIPGSKIVFKHNWTHRQLCNCAPSMKMGVFFWLHPCNPPKERHSIGKSSWNVTGGNLEGSGNVDFCTKQPADKQVLPKSDFWRKTCFCKWWVWSPAWSLRLPPSLTQHLHSFAFAPHCHLQQIWTLFFPQSWKSAW